MIVYSYDEKGFYSGTMTAQESPREPGVYLIPANCTDKKPPETGDRQCVVFENNGWAIKPDYRGVTYWLPDGSEHIIKEIDVVPPGNALYEKPVIPPTLEEAKASKLAELNAAFASASETAHCLSSFGFEINADSTAARNISNLIVVLEETDRNTAQFCAFDNTFHEVTLTQLKVMRLEIIDNAEAIYQRKWMLRKAINAAATLEELDAIKITFGEENGQTA